MGRPMSVAGGGTSMPEGTAEPYPSRCGCSFVVPERASFTTASVACGGFGSPNEGQRLGRDLTREKGPPFSVINHRPADQAGASVLSHVWG
jgi:hypothetical protein